MCLLNLVGWHFGWFLSSYEPYLWENERQSYLRHAVLLGFFVQLNRMYTDTAQKLPTNSESNIMRCSAVPRFKYLPIRLIFYLNSLNYTVQFIFCSVCGTHSPLPGFSLLDYRDKGMIFYVGYYILFSESHLL